MHGALSHLPVSSDPTYEAWKLTIKKAGQSVKHFVPILPMRHGNLRVSL